MIQDFTTRDVVYALIILGVSSLIAWTFSWRLQRLFSRLALKSQTSIGSVLLKSLRLPVSIGVIIAGLYIATISLPLSVSLDFEIRRGLYTTFLVLAGWTSVAVLDSVFRWYEVEVAAKTQTTLDNWIVGIFGILRVVTPLAAFFFVLVVTLVIFNVTVVPILDWLVQHGIRIGLIVLLSVVMLFILRRVLPRAIGSFVLRQAQGQSGEEIKKRADTLSNVLVTTGQVLVIAAAVFMILSELGINIAPILTGVGVVGLAIGFGAQTLVKDYLSGLFIILEDQYRVGDVVTISGISGLVEQIDLRRTVLRDMDGIQHVVSNGEIRIASNFTKEISRVNLNISVSYDTDLDHAIEVINRVCREVASDPKWAPAICKTPEVLRVDNFGNSGIDLKIIGETKPMRQWDVMGELRLRLKKAFDKEGIEIPWPHTKVYFGNWPPLENRGKGDTNPDS